MSETHVAVVPISALDAGASDALEYAATLAPRVLAIHLRTSTLAGDALERNWGARAPLIVVDAPAGDAAFTLRRVLEALERSQELQQITVVLPARHGLDLADWARADNGHRVSSPP